MGPPGQVGSPIPAAAPIQAQGSGGGVRIPPLTPDKVAQYGTLFERQPLMNGVLPGDQAKSIFEKSGLPNEILGQIWMLADTEQRGALVQTEFVIAMHLLTSIKTGAMRSLPTILPAPLYEAATRRGSASAAPRQSPSNTGMSAIPRQLSGQAQGRTGSPLGRPPINAQFSGGDWLVNPADKAKFDQIFNDLDKGNKGYITGDEAVTFFGQSNLGEEALAQIWDLSDINSQGQLGRDEFAVAMYLIRQQRGNRSHPLPATLPPNLIPPSLRRRAPQTSAFPPPAQPPPPPAPKSALDDLFGLDSTSSSTAAAASSQPSSDPFAEGPGSNTPSSPVQPTGTGGAAFGNRFVPTSSFGRGLSHQHSGNAPTQSTDNDDLLGGGDDEESKKITGESTELANISNQISSLAEQTQATQAKRTTTQNELNQTNSQKQNFEQRLSQLRTQYEKEVESTKALEEQLRKSRADTQKLQGECMKLDAAYRDVQTQHQELTTAFRADQQENQRLREQIRVVNAEVAQLKPQIEKLKSDARQQKGLAAINKKQLLTTEGERDKLKAEAEELSKGSTEELPRQVTGSATASPSAQVASPALSTSSGNNPFFKRSASTDIMGAFASPPARSYTDNTFDDVFGPSQPAGSSATPPPPASFQQQNTGTSTASVSSAPIPSAASPAVPRAGNDPPPPPESRQINSSFLPLPGHSDSVTSSRQVSPPASRAGESVKDEPPSFTEGPSSGANNLPGAFPGDEDEKDTPSANTPQGEGAASPGEALKVSDNSARASDPFGGMDQAKAKEEFDNAFAAFSSGSKTQDNSVQEAPKAKSAFDTEFPPISELERDDDSESDSEQGGFDDDFSPADQKAAEKNKPETKLDTAQEPKSPEPASSPATITQQPAPAPEGTKTNVDDIFGAAGSGPASSSQAAPAKNNTAAKGAFDDSDDDFAGLEDAKEGSADDDFANISRSGLDDFNPVFDSSPPHSQAKTDSSAFGNESSFDFIPSNTSSGAPAPASGNQQKGAETHDWDAIFSGLDSPSAAAATPVQHNGSNNPNELAPPDSRPPGPGRALTDSGEHDDPILKDLIAMGYKRSVALDALEKYDYNLEKVSHVLLAASPTGTDDISGGQSSRF